MPARNKSARRKAPPPPDATALPVHHPHAAGIDVGDRSHWACVEAAPGGADTVREFPPTPPACASSSPG